MDVPSVEKICQLKKSLYGLKQSLRAWFERFRMAIYGTRYKQCIGDYTLFYKHFECRIIILVVYVNDIYDH
jgi:Reverse transcriptase (RNA-dependent DNA polymerase)